MQTFEETVSKDEVACTISLAEAEELIYCIFTKVIKAKKFYPADELEIRRIIWAAENRKIGAYIVFQFLKAEGSHLNYQMNRGFSQKLQAILWYFNLGDVKDMRNFST